MLGVLVAVRAVLGYHAREGDWQPARSRGEKLGELGERDLVYALPFGPVRAGEYDAVKEAEAVFEYRKNGYDRRGAV